jgi:hypothetical protein
MKILIGFKKGNENEIESYLEKGFHIEDLNKHAKKLGSKIIGRELNEEEIVRVRESGLKVSSRFWVNLALMSAKNKDKILISNLIEEDYKACFSKII